jgi:hypothetical protein
VGTPGVVATVATADAADVAVSADGASPFAAADVVAIPGVVAIPVPVVTVGVGGCGVDGWGSGRYRVCECAFFFCPRNRWSKTCGRDRAAKLCAHLC